jgi:hypothetical protein
LFFFTPFEFIDDKEVVVVVVFSTRESGQIVIRYKCTFGQNSSVSLDFGNCERNVSFTKEWNCSS